MADDGPTRPARRMRVTEVLLAAASALWAGLSLLGAFVVITGRHVIGDSDLLQVPELPQAHADLVTGPAVIDVLDLGGRLLLASPLLATAAVAVGIALTVTRLVRGVSAGRPFATRTMRALRNLAGVLVIGGLVCGVLDTLAVVALAEARSAGERGTGGQEWTVGINLPDWPVELIAAGAVLGALSLAFREGSRLNKELAGVI